MIFNRPMHLTANLPSNVLVIFLNRSTFDPEVGSWVCGPPCAWTSRWLPRYLALTRDSDVELIRMHAKTLKPINSRRRRMRDSDADDIGSYIVSIIDVVVCSPLPICITISQSRLWFVILMTDTWRVKRCVIIIIIIMRCRCNHNFVCLA